MGKVRYNQSGYCGQSMSLRAMRAKDRGEKVLSEIKAADLRELGIGMSLKDFKAACKAGQIGATAWHHTGKYARETNFYDLEWIVELAQKDANYAELLKLDPAITLEYFAAKEREEEEAEKRREAYRQKLIREAAREKINRLGYWRTCMKLLLNHTVRLALPAFNAKECKIKVPVIEYTITPAAPVTIQAATPRKPGEQIPAEV